MRAVASGRGAAAGFVILLVAFTAAACGGGGARRAGTATAPQTAASPVCRTLVAAAVDNGKALLRAYTGVVSPGDLAFYDLRESLGFAQRHGCRPRDLGRALDAGFTDARFASLLNDVPATYVRYLRQALACFRGQLPAERCVRPAAVIEPPGAGKPSGTSHPLTP